MIHWSVLSFSGMALYKKEVTRFEDIRGYALNLKMVENHLVMSAMRTRPPEIQIRQIHPPIGRMTDLTLTSPRILIMS